MNSNYVTIPYVFRPSNDLTSLDVFGRDGILGIPAFLVLQQVLVMFDDVLGGIVDAVEKREKFRCGNDGRCRFGLLRFRLQGLITTPNLR